MSLHLMSDIYPAFRERNPGTEMSIEQHKKHQELKHYLREAMHYHFAFKQKHFDSENLGTYPETVTKLIHTLISSLPAGLSRTQQVDYIKGAYMVCGASIIEGVSLEYDHQNKGRLLNRLKDAKQYTATKIQKSFDLKDIHSLTKEAFQKLTDSLPRGRSVAELLAEINRHMDNIVP